MGLFDFMKNAFRPRCQFCGKRIMENEKILEIAFGDSCHLTCLKKEMREDNE